MFGTGNGKFMVRMVGRIQMIFLEGAKGVFVLASGMDRISVRRYHGFCFSSHRYLKETRKWQKSNASS